MGPTIILDKSILQSLVNKELIVLNQLFYINIPPILTIEILADLKKHTDESISEAHVKAISNKLLQRDSAISTNYINIIVSSLIGVDYLLERRVLVPGSNKVIDKEGNIGFVFDETPEEKALRHWQRGSFSQAEKTLAEHWRYYIKEIDIQGTIDAWSSVKNLYPNCKNLNSLMNIVESLLSPASLQLPLLVSLLEDFNVETSLCGEILYRFETSNKKNIKNFAPYVYFYLKVEHFFKLGLTYKLLSTKKTNKIDLEYIFYLPFCHIFSSNDNFHKQIVGQFIQSDQTFLDGRVLREELQNITMELKRIDLNILSDWQPNFKIEPVKEISPIICELWEKYIPNWSQSQLFTKSEKIITNKTLLDKIKEQSHNSRILKTDKYEKFDDSETKFIIRKGYISPNDQCPCGSGKILIECCYKQK